MREIEKVLNESYEEFAEYFFNEVYFSTHSIMKTKNKPFSDEICKCYVINT